MEPEMRVLRRVATAIFAIALAFGLHELLQLTLHVPEATIFRFALDGAAALAMACGTEWLLGKIRRRAGGRRTRP